MEAFFEDGNYSILLNPDKNEAETLENFTLSTKLQDGITFEDLGKIITLETTQNNNIPYVNLTFTPDKIKCVLNPVAYRDLLENQYIKDCVSFGPFKKTIEIQDGEVVA